MSLFRSKHCGPCKSAENSYDAEEDVFFADLCAECGHSSKESSAPAPVREREIPKTVPSPLKSPTMGGLEMDAEESHKVSWLQLECVECTKDASALSYTRFRKWTRAMDDNPATARRCTWKEEARRQWRPFT